jgi:diguanylate cyclase (GGDEF)-like protein
VSEASPAPRPPAPEIAALREALAASHFERVVDDGTALFRAAVDRSDWCAASDAALAVGRACSNLTRSSEAQRWTHEAAQAAQRAADAERECVAWGQLAAEHARHDRLAPALEAVQEMQHRLTDVQSQTAVLGLLGSTATTFYGLGLTGPALQAYERALRIAEELGEPGQVVTMRTNWLIVAHSHHRLLADEAPALAGELVARMERELELLEPAVAALGAPRGRWRLAHVSAAVHLDAGRPGAAAEVLQGLLAEAPALPPVLLASIWLDLAKSRQAQGDAAGARAAATEAEAAAAAPGDVPRSYDLFRRSEIAEILGRSDEALALYKLYHHRTRNVMLQAIESRLEGSLAQLAVHDAVVENQLLKARNEGLARGVAQLGSLAATDPLTELLNRRGFEAEAERLSGRRADSVLAVFDVDHFKSVNDRHGHAVGDRVLREVAQRLASALRPPDRLARHGGEEFVLWLCDVASDDALRVLERMRVRVAEHDWNSCVPGLRVTVSAGAVRPASLEPIDVALQRADRLLYEAKHGGRDRVVVDLSEPRQ